MILCGEDLSDAMSITKISKYVILPLADVKISILAISMYQSDYILVTFKFKQSHIQTNFITETSIFLSDPRKGLQRCNRLPIKFYPKNI